MKIKIKKLVSHAVTPEYQTPGAAGFDLAASSRVVIEPGETKIVPTGLVFEVPQGWELQVRPRSGLSYKTGLRVTNSPGTVDSDYRGEVGVIIQNTGDTVAIIETYDRIAQGVICPIIQAEFEEVENVSETQRGDGAFGSTGK